MCRKRRLSKASSWFQIYNFKSEHHPHISCAVLYYTARDKRCGKSSLIFLRGRWSSIVVVFCTHTHTCRTPVLKVRRHGCKDMCTQATFSKDAHLEKEVIILQCHVFLLLNHADLLTRHGAVVRFLQVLRCVCLCVYVCAYMCVLACSFQAAASKHASTAIG